MRSSVLSLEAGTAAEYTKYTCNVYLCPPPSKVLKEVTTRISREDLSLNKRGLKRGTWSRLSLLPLGASEVTC